MRLNADTELRFDGGGVLPANSYVLSFFSSVLRGATEAQSAADSNSSTIVTPMNGVTKAQWLAVAPFWYPIKPPAVVKTFKELDLVLTIGSRFDLQPALDRASDYLTANAIELEASDSSFRKRDGADLYVCGSGCCGLTSCS